jgi:dynein heavy chain
MVRKKLPDHIRLTTVALLTRHVHFRDILKELQLHQVQSRDEFKWQTQFKYEVTGLEEAVEESALEKARSRVYETDKVGVDFLVFNHKRQYSWEYLGNAPRLVITPLTERCQRSLIVALQECYGGAPEGPFGTGKTETIKDLSR